jgi:hypothetical protein
MRVFIGRWWRYDAGYLSRFSLVIRRNWLVIPDVLDKAYKGNYRAYQGGYRRD